MVSIIVDLGRTDSLSKFGAKLRRANILKMPTFFSHSYIYIKEKDGGGKDMEANAYH